MSSLAWDQTAAARARTARDWKVLGLGSGGAATGFAAAVWLFQFKSATAQVNCTFAFAGAGFGLGLGLRELPIDAAQNENGSAIAVTCAFSAEDLDGSTGMLVDEGADAFTLLTLGRTGITAFNGPNRPYFFLQKVPGPNSGLGIDASWLGGVWTLMSIRDLNNPKYFWNGLTQSRPVPQNRILLMA